MGGMPIPTPILKFCEDVMVVMEKMGSQAQQDRMGRTVKMAGTVGMARTVRRERGETLASKAHLDLLDLLAPCSSGGVVYTRWGRTTCPDTPGTELVYAGRAGGTHYTHKGGAADYLCMPESPEYLSFTPGHPGGSPVYGVEYETGGDYPGPLASVDEHNVPCSVCSTTARVMVLMLPAKTQCPPSWTLEYNGYLMTAHNTHHRTAFECMDKDPECIPGSAGNENGALFFHTEATCTGLPCPPYDTKKELTCAVCTK